MTTVGVARPDEIDRIADLYADAFYDDPVWSAIVPSDRARKRVIRQSFLRELSRGRTHHVDVVRDDAGKVVGALNYQTPDGNSHKQSTAERVADRAMGTVLPWMRRSERHESVMAIYHPNEAHWYFRDLVTDPAERGKGLGRALLGRRLELIDQYPLPVFLESTTPASRRLYERYGFECVGTVSELPGTESFAMIRPAQ